MLLRLQLPCRPLLCLQVPALLLKHDDDRRNARQPCCQVVPALHKTKPCFVAEVRYQSGRRRAREPQDLRNVPSAVERLGFRV